MVHIFSHIWHAMPSLCCTTSASFFFSLPFPFPFFFFPPAAAAAAAAASASCCSAHPLQIRHKQLKTIGSRASSSVLYFSEQHGHRTSIFIDLKSIYYRKYSPSSSPRLLRSRSSARYATCNNNTKSFLNCAPLLHCAILLSPDVHTFGPFHAGVLEVRTLRCPCSGRSVSLRVPFFFPVPCAFNARLSRGGKGGHAISVGSWSLSYLLSFEVLLSDRADSQRKLLPLFFFIVSSFSAPPDSRNVLFVPFPPVQHFPRLHQQCSRPRVSFRCNLLAIFLFALKISS